MRLLLVRHCQSLIDPSTSTSLWGLTTLGREQARALASSAVLDSADVLAAGPEPKMIETLVPTAADKGIDTKVDKAFAETASRGWLSDTEFTATVERFFGNHDLAPAAGWETSADAADRLLKGVHRLQARHAGAGVAICSGGRALTSLLVTLGVVDPQNAFAYWQRIRIPDLAVLDLSEQPPLVVRRFGTQV